MKKIKIVIGIVLVLVVLGVVAVLVVGSHLGDIVKAAMETVGPKITQTTLTVDSAKVSLLAGSAGIKGLVLGNPEGYKAPQSISIGSAAISLEPRSVLSDKIIIHSIELKAAEITFEGNPLGDNNLTKIMANANSGTASVDQTATNAPATASPAEKKAGRKLQVDDFLITGAKIHAHLTGLVNQEVTLPLPEIHLTNLGQGADGITAADLTQKVLSEITTQTVKTLASNATGMAKDLVNGALLNATNAAGQSVDKLKKGLGNLLGK
jgi:hypothetical protein